MYCCSFLFVCAAHDVQVCGTCIVRVANACMELLFSEHGIRACITSLWLTWSHTTRCYSLQHQPAHLLHLSAPTSRARVVLWHSAFHLGVHCCVLMMPSMLTSLSSRSMPRHTHIYVFQIRTNHCIRTIVTQTALRG